tara:strand:+ start:381 stop:503 length:123 start_codon:yes stop_codon:yes gene_type:complete
MLRSKDNLYTEIIKFIEDADDLIIYSPYYANWVGKEDLEG